MVHEGNEVDNRSFDTFEGLWRGSRIVVGAEGGTRTRTRLPSLDPEPSVSTIPPLRHEDVLIIPIVTDVHGISERE